MGPYGNCEKYPPCSVWPLADFLSINSLPNDKILDQSTFKAFANDKLKVIQTANFVLDKTENIVGKEENAGYQHFLLFPQCFQKVLSSGTLKVGTVW